MSKTPNNVNKELADITPSVTLKKDGIPSTQDILDIISFLEKERGLKPCHDMVRYLNTTNIEALDDELKNKGLKSYKTVKEVVNGIKDLKKVTSRYEKLHRDLTPYASFSYFSNLNDLIKPFAFSSIAVEGLQEAIKDTKYLH